MRPSLPQGRRDQPPEVTGPGRTLVVVCETEEQRCAQLNAVLSSCDCRVRHLPLAALVDKFAGLDPSLVVIRFSAATAAEVLATVDRLRRKDRRLPIILVVADGSEAVAIAALRAGAKDYFPEPVDYPAVAASIRRCLRSAGQRRTDVRHVPAAAAPLVGRLVGCSAAIRDVEQYLIKIAPRDSTVLITGETGTGKEVVAALIHDLSLRRHARFVSVNCAAIPEGLLESELFGYESGAFTGATGVREGLLQLADGGTVFLDEVGDMGLNGQAKLLRAIETREVYRLGGKRAIPMNLRVVAATNHDLETAMEQGRFRKDLYFRLNVARVHLPPLRERPSDIEALLEHFVDDLNRRFEHHVEGFSAEALESLKAYDWPGNVRELKNLLEAVFISAPPGVLQVEHLPERFRQRLLSVGRLTKQERQRLVDALAVAKWNKSEAAKLLHWSRMTVYRKMAKYSIIKRSPVP